MVSVYVCKVYRGEGCCSSSRTIIFVKQHCIQYVRIDKMKHISMDSSLAKNAKNIFSYNIFCRKVCTSRAIYIEQGNLYKKTDQIGNDNMETSKFNLFWWICRPYNLNNIKKNFDCIFCKKFRNWNIFLFDWKSILDRCRQLGMGEVQKYR